MQVDMPEFRYESDTGLTDATEATRKAIEDGKAPGAVPDCPNIAFEGTSTSGAEYRETGLMTFGSKCADEWTTAVLDMYVAGMSTNALPTGTHVGRPVNYQLAGHRAAVLNSRMARGDGGQPRYRTLSCALLGGKMDCWIFVADKCDDLHAMAQTKVTFRGHEPTEVVPVDSLPECK